MRKPNLFIVGNPKSGTSALHHFLEQHPDIFMSIPKEPKYFCKDFHRESDAFHKTKAFFSKYREEQDYLQLFSRVRKENILGEASPNYLYSKVAAEEIYKFNPDAKIIIMLRNPVDFIYSLHSQHLLRNFENVEDFKSALLLEKERREGKHLPLRVDHPSALYYSEMIKYFEQVNRYYGLFNQSNIKVIIYEDFKMNNREVYRDTLKFLSVDDDFLPDFRMVNLSKKPRNKKLNDLAQNSQIISAINVMLPPKYWSIIKKIGETFVWKEEIRPPMDSSLREKLMRQYMREVLKISDLLGIDLEKRWYQNCADYLCLSMNSNSSLSVVIPSYNSRKNIDQCLNSVLNQSYKGVSEIVVVDSSDDGTDQIIRKSFPGVKLIRLEKKTLPGAARNIGVKATNSEYIAFTDTDCIVDYYWIEKILERMREGGYEAVGGVIANGTPESISGTLGYLNEFSFYLPWRKTGFVDGLATANVCYRKCVFDKQQFMETHFAGEDTAFHWAMTDNGKKLFFDQTVRVMHMNREGFVNVLKHQRKMGEGAGIARIVMKRDLVLVRHPILSILVLPWIRVLRMYQRVFFHNKKLWKKNVLFLSLSLLIAYSWSLGFVQSLLRSKQYE